MFGGQRDYHGTRSYTADVEGKPAIGLLRLRAAFLLAWARIQLEKLFPPCGPSSREDWLVKDNERHFTLLGQPSDRGTFRAASQTIPAGNDRGPPRGRRPGRS